MSTSDVDSLFCYYLMYPSKDEIDCNVVFFYKPTYGVKNTKVWRRDKRRRLKEVDTERLDIYAYNFFNEVFSILDQTY